MSETNNLSLTGIQYNSMNLSKFFADGKHLSKQYSTNTFEYIYIYTCELGTSCTALKDATTKHCSHLSIATALYIGQFNWPTRGCLRHVLTILPTSAQ